MRSTGAAPPSPQTHAPTSHRRSLEDNQIGDEGAAALAEALAEGTAISNLDLSGNTITRLGIEWLAFETIASFKFDTRKIAWPPRSIWSSRDKLWSFLRAVAASSAALAVSYTHLTLPTKA